MRKCIFLILFSIILQLFTSCSALPTSQDVEFSIGAPTESLKIGERVSLSVKAKDSTKKVRNILWATSDPAVAEIDKNGVMTINGSGRCTITAVQKNNLENRAEISVFCPYQTTQPVEGTITNAQGEASDNIQLVFDDYAVWFGSQIGKNICWKIAGEVSSFSFFLTIASFFETGTYWFSECEPKYVTDDTILYTITDWTNEDVTVDPWTITNEDIYECLGYVMDLNKACGPSFDFFREKLRNQVGAQISEDHTYYLSQMSDEYEYRIVIRGDLTTLLTTDHCSNGLLSGLGYSIKDILNWDIQSLADNYSYEKYSNDILDVTDIRVCIESRVKQ